MKRLFFISLISLLIFIFHAIDAPAANWYVRPDGGTYGAEDGTDWDNAFDGFYGISWASVSCGDTVWVAGGTYTQDIGFQGGKDCTIGSQLYMRRARSDASECTSAAGWSAGFDATVLQDMADINYLTGQTNAYITISGRTIASGGGYGWKIYYHDVTSVVGGIIFWDGSITNNITHEYMEVEGPGVAWTGGNARGIDDTPWSGTSSYHTFSHMSIHGWGAGFQARFGDNHIYEYIDMYDIFGSGAHHPDLFYITSSHNGTIRYSKFYDSAASGTGIAFSDLDIGSGANNWKIYGNLFYDMSTSSGTAIAIQDAPANGLKIYNNVFSNNVINMTRSGGGVCGTGSETKNNIFYGTGGSFNCGTTSNNLTTSDDSIFVNRASSNFRIVSTVGSGYPLDAGTDLSATFASDMDGITFGNDGAWDIGAYEYVSGAEDSIAPSAPTGLSVQ